MSYALALIGFLGFFITNIYMIIQAVKKKFRKKLLLPPLICFILFIIGASLMPSSTKVAIKTIQISLENQETEYDINQTIPVSISVEPSDADISDLTYISSAGKSDTFATVYKGNIIKNLIMDCQSYTKYRPNETTGGIFVSWRRKEELPTGA